MLKACQNGATRVIKERCKRTNPFENITRGGDGNFEAYAQVKFQRV